MGSNVLLRHGGIAIAAFTLWLSGCQHDVAPVRLSVLPDNSADVTANRPTEQTDSPYVNPLWLDEEPSREPLRTALNKSGQAMGVVIAPFVVTGEYGVRWLSGDKPSAAVRLLEDPASADNRRIGMNKLVDFGFIKHDVFVKRCRQIAVLDSDYTVRATALRTENRARDPKASSIFIRDLSDSSEWVRLESAKGLVNVPDIKAAEPLVAVLNNREESRDVRVAAADALRHYRTLRVVRALSAMLHDKQFAIAWQSQQSLRYLTGRDFKYDEGAWLAYFTGPDKPIY